MDGDIDFTPWLDSGSDTDSGTAGFQGDFSVLHVDDDSLQTGASGRVQEGVDMVTASTVLVGAGTHTEQIVIDGLDVHLLGEGAGVTTIASPALLDLIFTNTNPYKPVITAMNSGNVVIEDLTVDGDGKGIGNNRFVGVAFWNSGGAVLGCDVVNVSDTPQSGVQHGIGIYSTNNTGGPYSLEVGNCTVSNYQKNAMALSGDGMTVDVHDCTTTGSGDVAYIAQNGIQISFGAGGSITDCTVQDMRYTPASVVASGILIYQGTTVTMSGNNVVSNVQGPVNWYDTGGTCGNVEIPDGGDFEAIFVGNFTAAANRGGDRPFAQPLEDSYVPQQADPLAPYTVSVTGGCVTGPTLSGTAGIHLYSAGQPLYADISNMSVGGWDYGIYLNGPAVFATANNNSIAGNTTAGLDNTASGNPVDAEQNWWGAVDGPSGVGSGSGDAVLGASVDFDPYRTSGASSTACAFNPVVTNEVTPQDPGTCINATTTCVPVDVDVLRSDSANMRGFSVDIQLTDLVLCGAGIEEGTYLSAIGGTVYQVIDNGGGSYTVDCAILGLPCGQTAAAGTLFTVNVAKDSSEGTGSIAVTDVTFRDCVNQPIPGTPGATLDITIDTVPPTAVANLSTTQVTSGNDGDGTTRVSVSFTAPGDAAVVEVYRAAYGVGSTNTYPEYDDEPGAGPRTAPLYAAVSSPPWQLTSLVASGDDETTERGYWYYVVFTKDACGNVSAVSNVSGGVLNYHLGDVTPPPGGGDNDVNVLDISALGASYGIGLAHNDPVNYLDVGPTADSSPNSLPQTDNLINFEDLIIFAINFGQVSATGGTPSETDLSAITAMPRVKLVRGPVDARGMADLHLVLHGHDQLVKGIHMVVEGLTQLTAAEVQPGGLVQDQQVPVFFKSVPSEQGLVVDLAALGNGLVLQGSGELATIRVPASVAAKLGVVDMRDVQNRKLEADGGMAIKLPAGDTRLAPELLPTSVELLAARPNPFSSSTNIDFRLPAEGQVDLQVFEVSGRAVRTLVSQSLPAGEHVISWDGRNDQGQSVGAGIFLVRLQANGVEQTQKVYRQR
ncbi:MAG: FlgD immunoglobulin-like domain containing protein [Candidatus Eisenbacteria bacterium]